METPLVQVQITNWNGIEYLDACLRSVLQTSYPNVRVLFLDNGSTDGSVDFVRSTFGNESRLEVLGFDSNRGWPGANNTGFERAKESGADYVLTLNNDTVLAGEAIDTLVERAE